MLRGMLPSAVCGPISMNMLGKPSTMHAEIGLRRRSAHLSFSRSPPAPRMSMRSKLPVMASKPVA